MVSDAHVLDMGFGLRRYLRKTNSCLYYSFAYPECTPVSALPSLSLCCHLYCINTFMNVHGGGHGFGNHYDYLLLPYYESSYAELRHASDSEGGM
ncbi:hypothetical protein SFRURICE_017760 [Spodoptera frugiperda]|nr:hypothetical protein SFRURICE_017760 [Spodoptera frugiperda]